ncbi:signal peptidase I [Paenibacillus sophorae]|uniref:Signal peptidase I n=1 Tax=Paenibacillus sophorae TaxID=1333845 RepID=A0A1H8H905_9BACL|nr:signal peptidase I [Paenibacillus sophorae]QWU14483.1 signal peptidase I [Paenibacillus sophorae]SEN52811.1 signal peptidase I [Paenibacillus sophorae]
MQQDLQQGQGESDNQASQVPPKQKNEALEWVKAIAIALILVFLIRWLLFKPFIVDGPSMQPNFHTGERVIVNEILYDLRSPQRGEVIVFHVPSEGRDFIKRVIAVAGDTVKVEGDVVTVNGKKVDETYIQGAIDQAHKNNQLYNNKNFPNEDFKDGVVPKGHVFAMGDNRSDSTDSRMIGYIPLGDIVGRADVIFWPVSDMEWIKH